ncbi:MAG: serine/threonine-protein phosphatase [Planctomyces sp.]|nr:serine/threonine-protein phosphatase [Planctomyces sp.]
MKLRVGATSIKGNFRDNNEDALHVDPQGRFFLVADGMGGQSAGERASALAMEIIPKKLAHQIHFSSSPAEQVVKVIDDAVALANTEIMALGELDSKLHNMGTTVTFAVIVGETMYAGGVGDSRTYLLRGQNFKQLTTDHSLTQALVDAGTLTAEEALTHRYRNVLYRYLGSKDGAQGAGAKPYPLQPGDRIVLCSDGATGGVSDPQLQALLAGGNDPEKIAEEIVKAAEAGGSKDNITVVVVLVEA